MSKLLSLLSPPVCLEEARGFIDSRFPTDPEVLAFRIIPGPLHDMALSDKEKELIDRFVERGEIISLPGQPPQGLSRSMCETIAVLLVCQCPPKQEATATGGITQDLTGFAYKPYTLDSWADLAGKSPEVFWAAVALVRLLQARASDLPTHREFVALAYQQEIPEGLSGDDFVSPTLEGLTEPVAKVQESGAKVQESSQGNE